jgi:hypothetical protein
LASGSDLVSASVPELEQVQELASASVPELE